MSYSSEVLSDNPLAYWRLGETSGTSAADSSGNARTATYNPGATLNAPSLISDTSNGAVTLNGTTGVVSLAYGSWMNPTTGFTAEAWIKLSSTAGGYVMGRWDTGNTQFIMVAGGDGNIYATYNISGTQRDVIAPYSNVAGVKTYVAMTYDGTTAKLYLNGTLANSGAYTGALNSTSVAPFYIGRISSSSSAFFAGTVDEVALYPTALSAGRVTAHYSAGISSGFTGWGMAL